MLINTTTQNNNNLVAGVLQQELSTALQTICESSDNPDVLSLKKLLDILRENAENAQIANEHIEIFIRLLRENSVFADGFCLFLLNLIAQYRQTAIYTDMGVLSDASFLSQFHSLLGQRILPPVPDDKDLLSLFHLLFEGKTRDWIDLIHERWWIQLAVLLNPPAGSEHLVNRLRDSILKAIVILSHRISGIGLHGDMLQVFPNQQSNQNTFIELNHEVREFVEHYQQNYLQTDNQLPAIHADSSQIFVFTDQAEMIVQNIRRRIHKTGITIRTTNILVRLEQNIHRLEVLLSLLSTDNNTRKKALVELIYSLYEGSRSRSSFRYLFGINTALLSRKVTENASKVGEHYISTDKKGYQKMYKKAAIGGLLIGFMASLKILASYLDVSLFGIAFIYSMIYGLGFVLIHVVGGTVATKQPAMTAAAIASTISEATGKKVGQMNKLAELVVDILRTQFIAIMGNISIAMPIALGISMFWLYVLGEPFISIRKSDYLLHELNPFTSLAVFHAGIAGVYLYISGLVAGYYDNLAVHSRIGDRLRAHPRLKSWLSTDRLKRISQFVEQNLGAMMSNFMFGVFLGTTGTIGIILGLPLDIRHIAFSSANFVHGVFNMYANTGLLPDIGVILVSFFGVLVIGFINLLVSFSLALVTALRARNVKMFEWQYLFGLVASHFISQPSDFFVPRKEPMKYALIDNDGNMIYPEENPEKTVTKPENPTELSPAEKLAKSEKLSQSEIDEKKQALREKVVDKILEPNNQINPKLPK